MHASHSLIAVPYLHGHVQGTTRRGSHVHCYLPLEPTTSTRLRLDSRIGLARAMRRLLKPSLPYVCVSSTPNPDRRFWCKTRRRNGGEDHPGHGQHHVHLEAHRRGTYTHPYRGGNQGHVPTTRLRPISVPSTTFARLAGALQKQKQSILPTKHTSLLLASLHEQRMAEFRSGSISRNSIPSCAYCGAV